MHAWGCVKRSEAPAQVCVATGGHLSSVFAEGALRKLKCGKGHYPERIRVSAGCIRPAFAPVQPHRKTMASTMRMASAQRSTAFGARVGAKVGRSRVVRHDGSCDDALGPDAGAPTSAHG